MIWTAWVNAKGARYPTELTHEGQPNPTANENIRPDKFSPSQLVAASQKLYVGHRFRVEGETVAETEPSARRTFNHWLKNGLPPNPWIDGDPPVKSGEKKMWHPKGAPHYLYAQATAMGLPDDMVGVAAKNEEITRLNTEIGGLGEQYHTARTAQAGHFHDFPQPVKNIATASLKHYEQRVARLHMLAAAAMVQVDTAWKAFCMDVPERSYRVTVGPPPVVEVRSTEDIAVIEALRQAIFDKDANIESLEATIRNFRTVQIDVIEPTPEVQAEPTCKESEPVFLTTPVEQLAPEPPKSSPPQQRKHQNPNHPSNKSGAR